MTFIVHRLQLFKNLVYTLRSDAATVPTESLTVSKNKVYRDNMNPQLAGYITDSVFKGFLLDSAQEPAPEDTILPTGNYLFVQGLDGRDDINKAAEALWLEALWLEIELDQDWVYTRKLEEDNKTVFQLFRKII